jgi:hypothetical protein
MEQVSFFEHDGTAPGKSCKEFISLTKLDCREIIDLVNAELSRFFTGTDSWVGCSRILQSAIVADLVERKATAQYSTFEPFRRGCHGKNAKAYFGNFVRRWIAEEMRIHSPDLHKKLPAEFRAAGMPIPKHRRAP